MATATRELKEAHYERYMAQQNGHTRVRFLKPWKRFMKDDRTALVDELAENLERLGYVQLLDWPKAKKVAG